MHPATDTWKDKIRKGDDFYGSKCRNNVLCQGETSARKLKNEAKREVAVSLLKMGKLTIEEIAECSELNIAEVEQLARFHTV